MILQILMLCERKIKGSEKETAAVCRRMCRDDKASTSRILYFKKARDVTNHSLFFFPFYGKDLLLKYKPDGIVMG